MDKHLKTTAGEALHLKVFLADNKLAGIYITGDTIVTRVSITNTTAGMLQLLAAYYAFDIAYPPVYKDIMTIFQTFCFEEEYCGTTRKAYKFFVKKNRGQF